MITYITLMPKYNISTYRRLSEKQFKKDEAKAI